MEPGGEEFNEATYSEARNRADLCEIATRFSYLHGAKIVDAILQKYDVTLR